MTPRSPKSDSPRKIPIEIDLWLASAILVGFLILCAMQVLSRFLLKLPFNWTEELVAALVIWMTFLGAIAVERRDSQIRVELIETTLPRRLVKVIYAVFDMAIVAALIAIVIGGWHTLFETAYQKTPALGLPLNLVTAIVPISALIMIFVVARNMIRRIRR